jgi:hypothetical protein
MKGTDVARQPDKNQRNGPQAQTNADHDVAGAFDLVSRAADPERLKALLKKAKADSEEEEDEARSA